MKYLGKFKNNERCIHSIDSVYGYSPERCSPWSGIEQNVWKQPHGCTTETLKPIQNIQALLYSLLILQPVGQLHPLLSGIRRALSARPSHPDRRRSVCVSCAHSPEAAFAWLPALTSLPPSPPCCLQPAASLPGCGHWAGASLSLSLAAVASLWHSSVPCPAPLSSVHSIHAFAAITSASRCAAAPFGHSSVWAVSAARADRSAGAGADKRRPRAAPGDSRTWWWCDPKWRAP